MGNLVLLKVTIMTILMFNCCYIMMRDWVALSII